MNDNHEEEKTIAEIVSEIEKEPTINSFPTDRKLPTGIVLNRIKNKKTAKNKANIDKDLPPAQDENNKASTPIEDDIKITAIENNSNAASNQKEDEAKKFKQMIEVKEETNKDSIITVNEAQINDIKDKLQGIQSTDEEEVIKNQIALSDNILKENNAEITVVEPAEEKKEAANADNQPMNSISFQKGVDQSNTIEVVADQITDEIMKKEENQSDRVNELNRTEEPEQEQFINLEEEKKPNNQETDQPLKDASDKAILKEDNKDLEQNELKEEMSNDRLEVSKDKKEGGREFEEVSKDNKEDEKVLEENSNDNKEEKVFEVRKEEEEIIQKEDKKEEVFEAKIENEDNRPLQDNREQELTDIQKGEIENKKEEVIEVKKEEEEDHLIQVEEKSNKIVQESKQQIEIFKDQNITTYKNDNINTEQGQLNIKLTDEKLPKPQKGSKRDKKPTIEVITPNVKKTKKIKETSKFSQTRGLTIATQLTNNKTTKDKTYDTVDQSFEDKSPPLLKTSSSLKLIPHILKKPLLKLKKKKKKHINISLEINPSLFETIPSKSITKPKQSKSKQHHMTIEPLTTTRNTTKPILFHQSKLSKNVAVNNEIKSFKKTKYVITKGFFDRQKSFLRRVDEKKKKIYNEVIMKETHQLNGLGFKCNKKNTNECIKASIEHMNEWEHKRLEHIKEMKKSMLSKSKEKDKEQCSTRRKGKQLSVIISTQSNINDVCNKLCKGEEKRKDKTSNNHKLYHPTFRPMLNSFTKNAPKQNKIKSKPFTNASMNTLESREEKEHKVVKPKKRVNLSQDDAIKIINNEMETI